MFIYTTFVRLPHTLTVLLSSRNYSLCWKLTHSTIFTLRLSSKWFFTSSAEGCKWNLLSFNGLEHKNVTNNHSLKSLGRNLDGFQLFSKVIPKLHFISSLVQWHKSVNQLLVLIILLKITVSNNLKLVKTSQALLWDDTLHWETKLPFFSQQ